MSALAAVQAGRPIRVAEFRRDAAALAARLPAHNYVVNLCTDRYRFMTGFAAALQRRQITLLPSANVPAKTRYRV